MGYSNRFVVDLIHRSLRCGMVIIPLLLVASRPIAAMVPDDKDKDKRSPSNSRGNDSGSRSDAPRYNPPPPRQTPVDNSPKPERTIRNDNPGSGGVQRFNPPPKVSSTPSSSPSVSNPPATTNSRPADTTSRDRDRKYSPVTTSPPKVGTADKGTAGGSDSQLRAKRDDRSTPSDIRKRLDQKDKKSDSPSSAPDSRSGGKTDNPGDKSGDKTLEKGRLDRSLPTGTVKNPDNTTPLKDKGVTPLKDKGTGPSDAKRVEDRGKPASDKSDRRDAFTPDRFSAGGANKGVPSNPGGAKADATLRLTPGIKTDGVKHPVPELISAGNLPKAVHDADLKTQREHMNHQRFDERVKSGELDAIAKGETAKKLNLADQYRTCGKATSPGGWICRNAQAEIPITPSVGSVRLANLHGVHPKHGFYCGAISPVYADHCFKFHYYGWPFFAGECWYPHWTPWVAWSWGYHCHPIWDPRPLWCRPIIYEPYIVWHWWQPPLWTPLPEVACGTWVDVKPEVIEPEQFDLQLLAVRMVDPGHPEEKLGPRYRVWFRNNSPQPITQPFSVMVFASNDKRFGEELPRTGVRVTSIEADDTQSVDLRLPADVYTMNRDAGGQPAPFEFLHFFVDANREINDVNLANNGALVPREEMLPVDPAAFELDPVQARSGDEVIVAGEGFGPQPGQVLLHIGGQEIQAEIAGWYDLGVKIAIPKMDIPVPAEADVIVVRGDGAAANPVKLTLLPGAGQPGTGNAGGTLKRDYT